MATAQAHQEKEDGRLVRGEATRERVLDAAERLFAERGFDGVSIRQIAAEAGVTLGVVGFHGGAKLDLFRTVLERRVTGLSAERRRRLGALLAGGEPPSLRQIMDAYISPYVDIASGGDVQWRAYAGLIAMSVGDDRWYPTVRELYDPVAREYMDAIGKILPDADRERLATAFVLAVASMLSLVASRVRIAALAGDENAAAPSPRDPAGYGQALIDFCTGGIERAVARQD